MKRVILLLFCGIAVFACKTRSTSSSNEDLQSSSAEETGPGLGLTFEKFDVDSIKLDSLMILESVLVYNDPYPKLSVKINANIVPDLIQYQASFDDANFSAPQEGTFGLRSFLLPLVSTGTWYIRVKACLHLDRSLTNAEACSKNWGPVLLFKRTKDVNGYSLAVVSSFVDAYRSYQILGARTYNSAFAADKKLRSCSIPSDDPNLAPLAFSRSLGPAGLAFAFWNGANPQAYKAALGIGAIDLEAAELEEILKAIQSLERAVPFRQLGPKASKDALSGPVEEVVLKNLDLKDTGLQLDITSKYVTLQEGNDLFEISVGRRGNQVELTVSRFLDGERDGGTFLLKSLKLAPTAKTVSTTYQLSMMDEEGKWQKTNPETINKLDPNSELKGIVIEPTSRGGGSSSSVEGAVEKPKIDFVKALEWDAMDGKMEKLKAWNPSTSDFSVKNVDAIYANIFFQMEEGVGSAPMGLKFREQYKSTLENPNIEKLKSIDLDSVSENLATELSKILHPINVSKSEIALRGLLTPPIISDEQLKAVELAKQNVKSAQSLLDEAKKPYDLQLANMKKNKKLKENKEITKAFRDAGKTLRTAQDPGLKNALAPILEELNIYKQEMAKLPQILETLDLDQQTKLEIAQKFKTIGNKLSAKKTDAVFKVNAIGSLTKGLQKFEDEILEKNSLNESKMKAIGESYVKLRQNAITVYDGAIKPDARTKGFLGGVKIEGDTKPLIEISEKEPLRLQELEVEARLSTESDVADSRKVSEEEISEKSQTEEKKLSRAEQRIKERAEAEAKVQEEMKIRDAEAKAKLEAEYWARKTDLENLRAGHVSNKTSKELLGEVAWRGWENVKWAAFSAWSYVPSASSFVSFSDDGLDALAHVAVGRYGLSSESSNSCQAEAVKIYNDQLDLLSGGWKQSEPQKALAVSIISR